MATTRRRISLFPLGGAVLYPGLQLPLHIFEPRYSALVSDALARDQSIGMIQPREADASGTGKPALFDTGCLGRIAEVEALDDGRFNLVLEGVSLFRITRELDVTTLFRQEVAAVRNLLFRFALFIGDAFAVRAGFRAVVAQQVVVSLD